MIRIIGLEKKFGEKSVIKDLNLTIPAGSVTCILGKSGTGKSLLLKQILGLTPPTRGKIFINNVDVLQNNNTEEKRKILKQCGYVFQFSALIDSITVFENIALTLLEKKVPIDEIEKIVEATLLLVNLDKEVLNKYPSELSGGMSKKVAIARTLVGNPSVILYDEPTTGLDPINSRIIHELIYGLKKERDVTSVIVSHSLKVFEYSDYVALLDEGTIKFFGSSKEVWDSKNPYIHSFIRGLSNKPDSGSDEVILEDFKKSRLEF